MNTQIVAFTVKSVKFEFDRYTPSHVYQAIHQFYPALSAKAYTPNLIAAFIPEGADPAQWLKVLRNVEYRLSHPKPKARSRSHNGTANCKHNPAEAVSKRLVLDALMEAF